jgi:mannose-6-phosphate isomerase-like protein (cupin superfamily)
MPPAADRAWRALRAPLLRADADARRVGRLGAETAFRVAAADTGGAWSLLDAVLPPHSGGPPPHWHARTTETFLVLDGAMTFEAAGREVAAGPGDVVRVPPGVVHTFRNPHDASCRVLSHVTPGSWEAYFAALPGAPREPAGRAAFAALFDNYQLPFHPAPERGVEAVHVPAAAAHTVRTLGVEVTARVPSSMTGGVWTLLDYVAPPHFHGPAPHRHARTTETFVVLAGTLALEVDGQLEGVEAGGVAIVPPNAPHRFWNPHDVPARVLVHLTPGGSEGYFDALASLVAEAPAWPPPDPAPLVALGERFDTFALPTAH